MVSQVWTYFSKNEGGTNAACNICSKVIKCENTTSGLIYHLRKVHRITRGTKEEDTGKKSKRAKYNSSDDDYVPDDFVPEVQLQTKDDIKVCIVDKSAGDLRISDENYSRIEGGVFESIFQFSMTNPSTKGPKFSTEGTIRGHRVISCDSEFTVNFLKVTMVKLVNLWDGCQLEVIPISEIPRLINISIVLPFPEQSVPGNFGGKVIRVIKTQNSDLNTDKWKVVWVGQPTNKTVKVILNVDEQSFAAIQARGGFISVGMREIPVDIGRERNLIEVKEEAESGVDDEF